MAEALAGLKLDGTFHKRPAEIEASIDAVELLTRDEILARLSIRTVSDTRYIRDEVIVYLIRQTRNENNETFFGKLFLAFRKRIVQRLPRGDDITSEKIRNYVVDTLIEQISLDRQQPVGRLDIFECRFGMAMKCLIIDAKRKVLPKANATVSLDVGDEVVVPDEILEGIQRLDTSQGDHSKDPHFRSDLARAISQLPEKEKQVATLMLMDMPDINNVTDGPSISKEMGKTPRTIQNIRSSAIPKLQKILLGGEKP